MRSHGHCPTWACEHRFGTESKRKLACALLKTTCEAGRASGACPVTPPPGPTRSGPWGGVKSKLIELEQRIAALEKGG